MPGQCATTATMEIVIVTPEFTITKTATEANYSSPGDILHYTIVVTNISILTLTDILVTDPHTGLSQTIASLAPNASETILTSYTVTQGDIDAGFVDNTASASYTCGGNTYEETATETVPAAQRPEITVNKDVNQAEISAPTTLTYTITVTNTGNVSLTNVVLTDDLAGDATLTSGDDGDGILEVGEAWIYTATYAATQADINAGDDLVNVASVTTTEITTPVTDDAVTTITATPAMTVEKVVDLTEISSPATLTYTITVTNTGNVSLTNVVLTDDLAGSATLTSGDDGDGILEVGEAWVYTATYVATQADIDAGTALVNTASVTTTEIPVAVTDDATTTIAANPAMTVEKTVDLTEISAPATLTYTITVTNTGNVSLTNVVITDTFAGGATLASGDIDNDGILDVGETWTYTADYAVTQADIDAGTPLVNVAICRHRPDQYLSRMTQLLQSTRHHHLQSASLLTRLK